jgi:pimeloyl-ACP methyl ester carboxylesterase
MAAGGLGEAKTIDIDGKVNYVGPTGSGPDMVLVHGLGGSIDNWAAVAPQLAERYRVTALDLRGFGRTPLEESASTQVKANRELLDRFLDEVVGGPAILVGNSMGGMISILEAAIAPEKVAALVLVDPVLPYPKNHEADQTVAGAFGVYLMENAEEMVQGFLDQTGPEQSVMMTLQLCSVDAGRIPQHAVEGLIALAHERAAMKWPARAQIEAARSLMELSGSEDEYWTAVRKVRAPTMLLHGEKDRLIPLAAAEAAAQVRPDWTFEVFDDIGHIPQLEAADRFIETVTTWLDRVDLGSRSLASPTI